MIFRAVGRSLILKKTLMIALLIYPLNTVRIRKVMTGSFVYSLIITGHPSEDHTRVEVRISSSIDLSSHYNPPKARRTTFGMLNTKHLGWKELTTGKKSFSLFSEIHLFYFHFCHCLPDKEMRFDIGLVNTLDCSHF